ncbi:pyridoxamine 5'-phosphate oxidase family protein [Streptomyces sp. NPDC088400]|uniref:pyridoxamine 5'-phosphate oxidase family protein n=1 Tax=Streptomyces sp. NPDC088400 TaxID=3365861 RepID=UPI0038235562
MTKACHPAPRAAAAGPRRTVELDSAQALALLSRASLGRIVFTQRALPAVRPVNHLVDDGDIIIRTHDSSALITQAGRHGSQGVVVAYQADDIDPFSHLGWSVVATGYCRQVTDPCDLLRYERLLHPWSDRPMDCAVRIRPHLVTGIRLVDAPPDPPH